MLSKEDELMLNAAKYKINNSVLNLLKVMLELSWERGITAAITVNDGFREEYQISSDVLLVNPISSGGFELHTDQDEHVLSIKVSINGKRTELLMLAKDVVLNRCGLVDDNNRMQSKPKSNPKSVVGETKDNVVPVNFGNNTRH